MSAVSTSRAKRQDPLSKKIPKNPKYEHVQATVDSGASISRYMRKIEDIRQNYKFRKDEIFKRMKVTTFVQLVVQVVRITGEEANQCVPETPASTTRPDTSDREVGRIQGESPAPSLALTDGDFGDTASMDTHRSSLISVAHGIGELDINSPPPAPQNKFVDIDCPYLLLDVREKDDYDMCHLISALSYPKANLSRATNFESKEMLAYKNAPGKIIIIYDEDERIAPLAATTLVQREYDNLFMLSGGLKVASRIFPEGLITGTVPPAVSGTRPKQMVPASQKFFTEDDVNKLEIYLDTALQDHSIGGSSSRLSKSGASSRASGMSGRSTARSTSSQTSVISDRPPFR